MYKIKRGTGNIEIEKWREENRKGAWNESLWSSQRGIVRFQGVSVTLRHACFPNCLLFRENRPEAYCPSYYLSAQQHNAASVHEGVRGEG
jgi:hypothetical protein